MKLNRRVNIASITLACSLASQAIALADPLSWGSTGAGGTGTWDKVTSNWHDGEGSALWSDHSQAVFGGASGTVTLSGTHTVSGISNSVAGYTLSGGGIHLAGGIANFNLPQNMTIASQISGSGSLEKTGAGQLTLSGNNTAYSGKTNLKAGWINAAHSNALGSGEIEISGANSTLGLQSVTLANRIVMSNGGAGTGPRIYMAAGTSTLNGEVSIQTDFSKFQIGSGTLIFNNTVTTSAYTIFSPVVSDGVIHFKGQYNHTGAGSTDHEGVGVLVFEATGNQVGTLFVRQGKVRTDAANALASSSILRFGGNSATNSTATATLDLNGNNQTIRQIYEIAGLLNDTRITSITAATLTLNSDTLNSSFSGSIEGAVGLIKDGAATLTLSGHNTYRGNTVVNDGTFHLESSGLLTFAIQTNGSSNQITGDGTILLDGTFAFDLTQADASAGNSWQIIALESLTNTTFGTSFAIENFIEDGSLWTYENYHFSTETGVLQVIPEPSACALSAMAALMWGSITLRRRYSL